jgi:hypothetical protein
MVGDVHARPDDLDDCEALMMGVLEVLARRPDVRHVWFLGDLHHTHAWVHVDVQDFWRKWLKRLAPMVDEVGIVVGNHDQAPSGNHAAQWYGEIEGVHVYDEARCHHVFSVVPYEGDKKQFILSALCLYGQGEPGEGTLLCHQTFAGAKFENGFYAPEGVSSSDMLFRNVISGHIHEPQTLVSDNVTVHYLGSPRWIGLNDANSDRFVYLVEMDGQELVGMENISTAQWCRRIVRVEVTPDDLMPVPRPGWAYHFDLKGPKAWCEEQAPKYTPFGKVRTFPEANRVVHVRESEGVFPAFRKFMAAYVPPNATPLERLKTMVEERFNG